MTCKKLLIAGGGHAHMMLLSRINQIISEGHDVTVVQPSAFHYYSGMGPGMLSGLYTAEDIRFQTRRIVEQQGGRFIQDAVERIHPHKRQVELVSGKRLHYDVLSCNTGSFVPFEKVTEKQDTLFSVKPIVRLHEAKKALTTRFQKQLTTSAVIIGGGPAAIEIAGNIDNLAQCHNFLKMKITVIAGKKILKNFSSSMRRIVRKNFSERKITIIEKCHVEQIIKNNIHLTTKRILCPDFVFLATGVRPSPIFSASGFPTGPDSGLVVNEYLQCPLYPEIFGGGDCIYFAPHPLAKVGVYAVRQNPVLLHNIRATLNERSPLQPFQPGGNYLTILNLGKGYGVLEKGAFTWGGKAAFFIKDYIDKKFMKKYQ